MWSKKVLVAGLLGGLVLGLGAARPAAAEGVPDWCGTRPPTVIEELIRATLWGRLQVVVPPMEFPDGREIYCPDYANRYLAVIVNGRTYRLDFGSKLALWQQAEKLRGRRVIVEGELQGDRVLVTGLSEDWTNWQVEKIAVEIKGKLGMVEDIPQGPGPHFAIWKGHLVVRANGREFRLDLRNVSQNIWELERQYRGQLVHVSGTLEGDSVRVSAIKAAGEYFRKTVVVEIKGKLQCLWIDVYTGKFHSAHDTWAAPECIETVPGIVIDGKVYRLQDNRIIPAPEGPAKKYRELCGRTVVVTGTLEGETVTVRTIQAIDSPSIKETVTVEVKGTLFCEAIAPAIYPCPEHLISRTWTVRAEGKVYTLDFGGNKVLEGQARLLEGGTVVLRGTLKDGVITVTGLDKA
jgi:hypothetical protein